MFEDNNFDKKIKKHYSITRNYLDRPIQAA